MSDNTVYVSVLSPATAGGSIVFSAETYDAETDISFTGTVTILNGDSEETIAVKIKNQLTTQLTTLDYLFSGYPVFSTNPPTGSFAVVRARHIVSIFSEAQFSLALTSNNTGANVYLDSVPIPMTLPEAKFKGPIYGQDFLDDEGNLLSDDIIIAMLAAASTEITEDLNNPIVARTCVYTEICGATDSIFLNKTPVVSWVGPSIKRPQSGLSTISPILDSRNRFMVNSDTGEITYRYAQPFLMDYAPFDKNNELKMSYVAGHYTIPNAFKNAIYQWTSFLQETAGGSIKELAGGTFKVKFGGTDEDKTIILLPLSKFRLPAA
jgi:hypothetical protein